MRNQGLADDDLCIAAELYQGGRTLAELGHWFGGLPQCCAESAGFSWRGDESTRLEQAAGLVVVLRIPFASAGLPALRGRPSAYQMVGHNGIPFMPVRALHSGRIGPSEHLF